MVMGVALNSKFGFKELKNKHSDFFNILPIDWQNSILPYWNHYSKTTKVFVVTCNEVVIAGGLVFNECSPDMENIKNEAEDWFKKGYLYIGYVFVSEKHRNLNIGSFWLQNLILKNPIQKYWLTVEEQNLISFYTKNNFEFKYEILNNKEKEWLLCSK